MTREPSHREFLQLKHRNSVARALRGTLALVCWISTPARRRQLPTRAPFPSSRVASLVLLLAAWFALIARFPKHRPASKLKHLALMALTAAVPVALSCSAVFYAITRYWAQGFLPDTLTVVPFPVAAVLSTALVCTLPAVWVQQRKAVAVEGSDG